MNHHRHCHQPISFHCKTCHRFLPSVSIRFYICSFQFRCKCSVNLINFVAPSGKRPLASLDFLFTFFFGGGSICWLSRKCIRNIAVSCFLSYTCILASAISRPLSYIIMRPDNWYFSSSLLYMRPDHCHITFSLLYMYPDLYHFFTVVAFIIILICE